MAKKKPKSKVKELDASNGLIDISETSQKDDVKQESKWQSFKKRLRNEDDEPVIQFEGKFKDNKFLDDIRPKEGYCFRSDYFEIDDKYAKIVTFVNKGSSKKTLPIFWGINLIPQGVQQDVTIVLLKSVDRMTDAWIETINKLLIMLLVLMKMKLRKVQIEKLNMKLNINQLILIL